MINIIFKRRHWLIVLAALLLAQSGAFAIRVNLKISNVPSGFTGPVQLVVQNGPYDIATNTSNYIGGDDKESALYVINSQGLITGTQVNLKISGGQVLDSGNNEPSGAPGQALSSAPVDINSGTTMYIRVWDGAMGVGHRYAQAFKAISWLATDAAVDWPSPSWSTYLANSPQNVGIRVDSEAIQRGAGGSQALTLGVSSFDDGNTESDASKNILQISKMADFSDVSTANGNSVAGSSASFSGAYFAGSTTYYIRAQRASGFGVAPASLLTSPVITISDPGGTAKNGVGKYATLGGGGTGVGGGIATFALVAGINTISVPCDPTKAINVTYSAAGITPKTVAVTAPATVGKLLAAINSAVGANTGVIGFYDGTAKQHVGIAGITYSTDGAVTGGQAFGSNTAGTAYTINNILGMSLSQGQALQVSINASGTLTISQ